MSENHRDAVRGFWLLPLIAYERSLHDFLQYGEDPWGRWQQSEQCNTIHSIALSILSAIFTIINLFAQWRIISRLLLRWMFLAARKYIVCGEKNDIGRSLTFVLIGTKVKNVLTGIRAVESLDQWKLNRKQLFVMPEPKVSSSLRKTDYTGSGWPKIMTRRTLRRAGHVRQDNQRSEESNDSSVGPWVYSYIPISEINSESQLQLTRTI